MSLRWGILATGYISGVFAADLRTAGLDLRAVGSRSIESSIRFSREHDVPNVHASYEALVEDPEVDIVYVGTPHPMHAANATLALEHGKHVLVEKAFTLTAGEAAELRDLAAEKGLLVAEAMWTRYLPHVRRIHEIIDSGALGEVRAVFADHTQRLPSDPGHRLNSLELGGGALLDLGIYPVSFAIDILGVPTSVSATARLGATGADTEVGTLMTHPSGAVSTSLSSSRAAGPSTAAIVGTEGRIEIDGAFYAKTSFTHRAADGGVVERYESDYAGRGMQFEAIGAERLITEGNLAGDVLTIDESVAIMGVLDEIRSQIGVRFPGEA